MESDGQALLKLDALHGTHAMLNSGAHARLHRSYGNGIGPLSLQLRSQSGKNETIAARTGAPMTSEPTRVSSQEKRGKPQGCHERLLHHTTARACIGLRSPARGGEHDNGSTLQLASGTVGASVFKDTMTVHLAALPPPIHVGALPSYGANMRARRGGLALHGTQDCRASWGLCVAWDSLTLWGFVMGAMHCVGLAHASSLSSSEKSEAGGGCLECAGV